MYFITIAAHKNRYVNNVNHKPLKICKYLKYYYIKLILYIEL